MLFVGLMGVLAGLVVLSIRHGGRDVGRNWLALLAHPLLAYASVWLVAIALHAVNPFGMSSISSRAFTAIMVGSGCVGVGFFIWDHFWEPTPRGRSWRVRDRRQLTSWILAGLTAAWGILFIMFVDAAVARYDTLSPLSLLSSMRGDVSGGDPPLGFHYFYFAELLVPFAAAVALARTRLWKPTVAIGVVAFGSLLLTTARTNSIKTLVWTAVVVALMMAARRSSQVSLGKTARVWLGLMAVSSLLLFGAVGEMVGKTYESSRAGRGSDAEFKGIEVLGLPYVYVSGPPVGLSALMEAGYEEEATRGTTVRPVFQVAGLLEDSIEVPEKLDTFYSIPFGFNMVSYLGPLWRDAGWIGIALGGAFLGVLGAWSWRRWCYFASVDTALLLGLVWVGSVMTLFAWPWGKFAWLLQLGLMVSYGLLCGGGASEGAEVGERRSAGVG